MSDKNTIYMQIQGIDGNVSAKGYEKNIELESINFGATRQLNTQPGRNTNREGSRPTISEFSVVKKMDKATPHLFNESVVGKAKPQIKINLMTTNNPPSPYMEYTLHNVIVSGYKVSHGSSNSEKTDTNPRDAYPTEEISFNFDKIEMKFTPYDANHKPESPIPTGYDLKEATEI